MSLPGRHVVWNALAAIAAASEWGIGAEEARRVLPICERPRCAAN